jgi:hypothetical protein
MNKNLKITELLKKTQNKARISTIESKTGVALFSEFGARLLGLFPSSELPNTLWVPEDIDGRMLSNDWLLGGERLWIAPQRDYFFTDPQNFGGFHVPPHLDPGHYEQKKDLSFTNTFILHDQNLNQQHNNCEIKRHFKMIETDPYESGLSFTGVTINDSLSVPNASISICAWSIAMVPTIGPQKPGTALLPIANSSSLVNYFDTTPSDRSSVENGVARFLIDSKKHLKLAVTPAGILWNNSARVIYIAPFPDVEQWFCLIKRSDALPKDQDDCVDIPANNQLGLKGAVQVYNHGYGSKMHYGEIELQFPKGILNDVNRIVSGGEHELLSYCGSKEEILNLAKQVLGTARIPQIYA